MHKGLTSHAIKCVCDMIWSFIMRLDLHLALRRDLHHASGTAPGSRRLRVVVLHNDHLNYFTNDLDTQAA